MSSNMLMKREKKEGPHGFFDKVVAFATQHGLWNQEVSLSLYNQLTLVQQEVLETLEIQGSVQETMEGCKAAITNLIDIGLEYPRPEGR